MVDISAMTYSSAASLDSISLCALPSISLRKIFSAPATANAETCARKPSLARFTSWSISALAPVMIRSPSALAVPLASSTICEPRFSAWPIISLAFCLASVNVASDFLAATSKALRPS